MLYFTALTKKDWEENCDQSRTDAAGLPAHRRVVPPRAAAGVSSTSARGSGFAVGCRSRSGTSSPVHTSAPSALTVEPVTFKDHFSRLAAQYAEFRPRYPGALFDLLARIAPARARAWDCACGSGQATLDLAERFDIRRRHGRECAAGRRGQAPSSRHVCRGSRRSRADSKRPRSTSVDRCASTPLVRPALVLRWKPVAC